MVLNMMIETNTMRGADRSQNVAKKMIDIWQLARQNWPLALLLISSAAWLMMSIAGLLFDTRSVLNAPNWAKSFKFSISMLLYAPAVAWTVGQFRQSAVRRLANIAGGGVGIMLLVELVAILLQTLRGEASHFNVSDGIGVAMWSSMAIAITLFWCFHAVLMVLLWRRPGRDAAMTWALRLAFGVSFIGFGQGFLMTGPTEPQMTAMQAGVFQSLVGAHTVGAPDGGVGLPLLGWSTTHGDLRIGHFIGIHAIQAIPLMGWLIARNVPALQARLRLVLLP